MPGNLRPSGHLPLGAWFRREGVSLWCGVVWCESGSKPSRLQGLRSSPALSGSKTFLGYDTKAVAPLITSTYVSAVIACLNWPAVFVKKESYEIFPSELQVCTAQANVVNYSLYFDFEECPELA